MLCSLLQLLSRSEDTAVFCRENLIKTCKYVQYDAIKMSPSSPQSFGKIPVWNVAGGSATPFTCCVLLTVSGCPWVSVLSPWLHNADSVHTCICEPAAAPLWTAGPCIFGNGTPELCYHPAPEREERECVQNQIQYKLNVLKEVKPCSYCRYFGLSSEVVREAFLFTGGYS